MKGKILIIAGSDSGGGAGIQGDIKTVAALGGYAMTAITAITVQNTQGVSGVHAVPPDIIAAQMRSVLDDIGADIIKTGMLHDAAVIEAVLSALENYPAIPLIVDPVMVAKSGSVLLADEAVRTLKTKLLPRAALITPNLPEAETLLERSIKSVAEMKKAVVDLQALGPKAVLLKGGHGTGENITDLLWDGAELTEWTSPRIITKHTHGTGCTLASAIATGTAQGLDLKAAIARARDYVQGAMRHAPGFGMGHGPLNHGWQTEKSC